MDAATTVAVTTSASILTRGGSIIIRCDDANLWVGGSGVTSANGIPVAQGTLFAFDLHPDEDIYVVADGTGTVRLLRSDGTNQ